MSEQTTKSPLREALEAAVRKSEKNPGTTFYIVPGDSAGGLTDTTINPGPVSRFEVLDGVVYQAKLFEVEKS